jgi:hypothetical protein
VCAVRKRRNQRAGRSRGHQEKRRKHKTKERVKQIQIKSKLVRKKGEKAGKLGVRREWGERGEERRGDHRGRSGHCGLECSDVARVL